MKKGFKSYAIIWATLFAIYNLIIFLVKPIPGYVITYDARFWISWGVIIATYIGQLFCAKVAFDSKNNEKFFLNIPLITQSYAALIFAVLAGSVLMLIPDCPPWIAAIVCATVFGLSVISVIKAKTAADIVSEVDEKVKANTFFIKSLTADAESLLARAKNDEIQAMCKKVYEAARYSDPMSNDALASIESEITIKFARFSETVEENNPELASETVSELIILLNDRNKKCKLLK